MSVDLVIARAALVHAEALDAAAAALVPVLDELGGDAAFVALRREASLETARVTAHSPQPVYFLLPLDAPFPLAATVRDGTPLYVESNAALACDHPGLVRLRHADHACATLPLVGDDETVVGALNVTFEEPHAFGSGERARLAHAAAHCLRS